eukprot:1161364-Pelagomonas_calceolata.AAC.7
MATHAQGQAAMAHCGNFAHLGVCASERRRGGGVCMRGCWVWVLCCLVDSMSAQPGCVVHSGIGPCIDDGPLPALCFAGAADDSHYLHFILLALLHPRLTVKAHHVSVHTTAEVRSRSAVRTRSSRKPQQQAGI